MPASTATLESKNSPSLTGEKPPVICVFCGSSSGKSPIHLAAARSLAEAFARHNAKLVYGGGTVGLMGEIARTLVKLSGPDAVHGVIPRALEEYEAAGRPTNDGGSRNDVENGNDWAKNNSNGDPNGSVAAAAAATTTNTINDETYGRSTVVKDMHARKALMAELVLTQGGPGSGFVALSGGYGTLEEVMEVTTWNQLGIHDRGVCLYNVAGYWDPLLQWIDGAVDAGFVSRGNRGIIVRADSADGVMAALRDYQPPEARFKLDWKQK